MMEFSIQLAATDPARNIWRSYLIAGGQDLFGNWIVELTYGRIGAKGRTKAVLVADEAAAHRLRVSASSGGKAHPNESGWATEP